MPPEQAAGKIDQVGPVSDVYSLGAILYCLLTGRPPFQAASAMDTLLQVMEKEPVPVRQLNPQVALDLDTITQKCLAKNPRERYASAQALHSDLMAFTENRAISARRATIPEKLVRWFRRQKPRCDHCKHGRRDRDVCRLRLDGRPAVLRTVSTRFRSI